MLALHSIVLPRPDAKSIPQFCIMRLDANLYAGRLILEEHLQMWLLHWGSWVPKLASSQLSAMTSLQKTCGSF